MTTDEIIETLVRVVPEELDRGLVGGPVPNDKPVPRCLAAARAGIEALSYFGVRAEPVPVQAIVGNETWAMLLPELQEGRITEADLWAKGGYAVGIELRADQGPRGWPGHMLVGVPKQDVVLDLDLGQFTRPEHDIVLPPAAVFPVTPDFWTDPDATTGEIVGNAYVAYRRVKPERRWSDTGDWRKNGPRTAGRVIHRLKEMNSDGSHRH